MATITSTDVSASRNNVVYRCLTPDPAQALLFGGGATGGSVHTPDDSLYLLIGRCDIWNESNRLGALAAVRVRAGKGLFTAATAVRQACQLLEARIVIALDTADDEVRFTLTALRDRDVICLDVEDDRRDPQPLTVSLENWHEGDESGAADDTLWTRHVNQTSCFDAMNRAVGLEADLTGDFTDPLLGRTWAMALRGGPSAQRADDHTITLPAGPRHRVVIATACEAQARETCVRLAATTDDTLSQWSDEHAAWWRAFWSRSSVALFSATGDAEYEERLWHVTLYTIACGSGGPLPIAFNGGPYLLERDARSWNYEYVFQNMREVYWPLFAAGHWRFIREYFQLYLDARNFVRAQTRSLLGRSGLCFREAFSLWGCDVSPNNGHSHYYFSGSLECCLLMQWYVQASGDDDFLRDGLYPLLKEILAFYMDYATRSDDGRWHIAPANALETWWQVRDPMPDLCGLHHMLPRAIAWGERFGEDGAALEQWRSFLRDLAPIPVGRWTNERRFDQGIHDHSELLSATADDQGIFMPAAGPVQPGGLRRNMENAELYAVFPWGRVGVDSPAVEIRRVEQTWEHRTWRYLNNGWGQDAIQLARMGMADRACAAQLDHAGRHQRYPNGCFISPAAPLFHGLVTDTPYFDAAGIHAATLNEMLLQSYDGVIRIAPAVVAVWSGSFKLHAFGGFVVEAQLRAGRPVAARITATRDGQLRMRNNRSEPMRLDNAEPTEAGGMAERTMRAGEAVTVRWQGVEVVPLVEPDVRPEVLYPGYKVQPPLVATRRGHWHDESTHHGQIGLAADGSFPATRSQTDFVRA
jgi:hypothetical protein